VTAQADGCEVVADRYAAGVAERQLGDLEERAWAGFLRTHERLWRALEAGLATLEVSMAEYDVLVALDAVGAGGMRMSDLAERRLMSSGGFTRLADRLERRGLLERRRSSADLRSLDAVITSDGRRLVRRARRRHHEDLWELFFRRLEDDDLHRLAEIWEDLDPSADPGSGTAAPDGC